MRGGEPDAFADRFPWLRVGRRHGGVVHRRRARRDDIGALGLTKIGCGSVWQGFYMFHGGTNPAGELTPLQESHATGYPNDLPVLTYDFQAPLGEYGQYRRTYHELRLQHLLLADFGHLVAPMESVLPELRPAGQGDRETLRWAVRADGGSGFLFVTNHQPHERLPDHPGTSFMVEFPGDAGTLTLPSTPVTVPTGAYFCWPLRLDVAGLRLEWATAQPVCLLDIDGRTVLVLAAVDGIAPELALDAATVTSVSTPSGNTVPVADRLLVTGLRPGTDALVEVETVADERIGLLVLDAATARTAYRGRAWGAERLVLSEAGVVFDREEVRLHGSPDAVSFAVLPAPSRAPVVDGAAVTESADGVFTRYSAGAEAGAATGAGDAKVPAGPGTGAAVVEETWGADAQEAGGADAAVVLLRSAGPAPEPATGVLGRASAPAEKYFDSAAAEYRIDVPDGLPPGTLLRLHWTGDVGRAYVGDTLVADQFFSGRVWDIGLDRLPGEILRTEGLRLRVLPSHPDAAVYVPRQAGDRGPTAAVTRAEWVTARTWALRAG
ncbi:hypothetical protein SALBM311S_08456 [Streptomyces alboniger]